MFFPRFVPEKHRHARFLRFKTAGGAHDGGAFGMGIGRRQKKLHSFTPKAEEFLKKVHDFVAKIPLFWGTVGVQMARGALFGVFCAQLRSRGDRFAWADDEREYRRREAAEQNGGRIKRRAASVGGNCSWCCPQVAGKNLFVHCSQEFFVGERIFEVLLHEIHGFHAVHVAHVVAQDVHSVECVLVEEQIVAAC